MLAWGVVEEMEKVERRRGYFQFGKTFSILSMSGAPTSLGQLQSAGVRVRWTKQGRSNTAYFADWIVALYLYSLGFAGDFRCMGSKADWTGLDRLEGQMPHRSKGWGEPAKTSHSSSTSTLLRARRTGRRTSGCASRGSIHVENLPLAVRVQHADSDHVPSFKTVMAFPPCSTD